MGYTSSMWPVDYIFEPTSCLITSNEHVVETTIIMAINVWLPLINMVWNHRNNCHTFPLKCTSGYQISLCRLKVIEVHWHRFRSLGTGSWLMLSYFTGWIALDMNGCYHMICLISLIDVFAQQVLINYCWQTVENPNIWYHFFWIPVFSVIPNYIFHFTLPGASCQFSFNTFSLAEARIYWMNEVSAVAGDVLVLVLVYCNIHDCVGRSLCKWFTQF